MVEALKEVISRKCLSYISDLRREFLNTVVSLCRCFLYADDHDENMREPVRGEVQGVLAG